MYNNALHVSTQQTPFFTCHRHHPHTFPSEVDSLSVPAAEGFAKEMEAMHSLLKEQLDLAKESYKKRALSAGSLLER